MNNSVTVSAGGVSFETARNTYRGSVSVNGVRYLTKRCKSRRTALRELSLLRKRLMSNIRKTQTTR